MLEESKYIVLDHENGYTEFYDDKQDIEDADEVEIKTSEETTSIDFALTPDRGFKFKSVAWCDHWSSN